MLIGSMSDAFTRSGKRRHANLRMISTGGIVVRRDGSRPVAAQVARPEVRPRNAAAYRARPAVVRPHGPRRTRALRALSRLGLVLMVGGALTLVWAVVVWQWEDPFTALYTLYEQHQLDGAYAQRAKEFQVALPTIPAQARPHGAHHAATVAPTPVAQEPVSEIEHVIALAARSYRLSSHEGEPLGRIIIPRLGLNMIFVDGTSDSSLEKGPGRDLSSFLPGENRLVYIAGHRTTFLAPFSAINTIRPGDLVTLELPYATFIYKVTEHIIVPASDVAVLQSPDHELLALQACNPRFFATQRYIVYALPERVIPEKGLGRAYTPA